MVRGVKEQRALAERSSFLSFTIFTLSMVLYLYYVSSSAQTTEAWKSAD